MNELLINGIIYKVESMWRDKNEKTKDMNGNIFPFPKEGVKWTGKEQFLDRLQKIQNYIENIDNNDKMIVHIKGSIRQCKICDEKKLSTKSYILDNYTWSNSLTHYVDIHNIQPSREFIDKIFEYEIKPSSISSKSRNRLKFDIDKFYLKLDKNQIMILDALMRHGGYNKKYYDVDKKSIVRYSEHAGFIDIREKYIQNIIVSGNTLRVDRGDEEIFLPMNTPDAFDYEYIFHTHPPTPKPGGRAKYGILYEFPSMGDIFHFIDHYNDGKTVGSLVMTSEGLYNIRKNEDNSNKIKIDEDAMYDEMRKLFRHTNEKSIKKYGENFTTYTFYSVIANDLTYINDINTGLSKYHIFIDYYPRIKDFRGSWIIDTIYIPIYKK